MAANNEGAGGQAFYGWNFDVCELFREDNDDSFTSSLVHQVLGCEVEGRLSGGASHQGGQQQQPQHHQQTQHQQHQHLEINTAAALHVPAPSQAPPPPQQQPAVVGQPAVGVPVQQITTQMPLPMNQLSSVHPHAAQVHLQQAQHHVPVAYHMALPEPSKPAAVATPALAVTKTERKRKNKANREKVSC